ncbi:MAG TPA: CAP domain-containing protein [Chitinophagaceae bacterium]|nr:CAP domain-containing protein [Chitinophagaceae bacterium]
MKPEEKEMIYEINRVRSNPGSCLVYIEPLLLTAKNNLKNFGKGSKNYSVSYITTSENGKETKKTDTTWNYANEEEVKALSTLINDLKKIKKLSVLQPDSGIYNAAKKHAKDQDQHQWLLLHTGSDGSQPWDRITKFSPAMKFGNENIAGCYPEPTAREIVLQLLIDSGIPGYGHRYNLLDPQWTHVACVTSGLKEGMYRWIQDFGRKN